MEEVEETVNQSTEYQLNEADQKGIQDLLDQLPILSGSDQEAVRSDLENLILKVAEKAKLFGQERMYQASSKWYEKNVLGKREPPQIDDQGNKPDNVAKKSILEYERLTRDISEQELPIEKLRIIDQVAEDAMTELPSFPDQETMLILPD